jgi:hypothetical protein
MHERVSINLKEIFVILDDAKQAAFASREHRFDDNIHLNRHSIDKVIVSKTLIWVIFIVQKDHQYLKASLSVSIISYADARTPRMMQVPAEIHNT